MSEESRETSQPIGQPTDIRIVGYCRTCGVGLDEANVRMANGTIYCANHVPPADTSTNSGSGQTYQSAYAHSPYTAPPTSPGMGDASPGTAFLLGLIPGVGAIYNGQYLKGLIHIFILGLLFSAADHGGGALFGLMIPGFWFYMAFEAYHTARRKREGLPVDDFSGLDMGRHAQFPFVALLLIVFGVFFLLDNLGVLDFRSIMKFWPVGMIAIGLYMLYARMSGGRS
jgi:hypothetical protein